MESGTLEKLVVELATQSRTRHFGKYRGLVTDNEDPSAIGRIKAQVPEIFGELSTPWATPCSPYAGPGVGFHAIPPVGAGVWIEFEAGDPSRPIWTGGWWGTSDVPADEKGTAAKPALKILRSEKGLMVALDDDANTLTLSDGNGSNLMTISVNDGQIKLLAATKVIVEAPLIELTEGATHPVAFGDSLLQYLNQLVSIFNAHMHVGETVIGIPVTPIVPVTPFPPATPALLSTRVTTG
ncbi:MAG: phage baseplate assembly protein V [Aquabacterium sp.]|uniref:phage baseplate assembly protein V n=1 Tax=Aquabacterium sp. TaxID=1872578 RepID=UPI0027260E1A|nr:phage baseplate assembly protein V [Aquabacterium sp.]MDO9006135.1 phage baseplate assembly protein V [Aquabacterium sp.]